MNRVIISVLVTAIVAAIMSNQPAGNSEIKTMEISTYETSAVESPIDIYETSEIVETTDETVETTTEIVDVTEDATIIEEVNEPEEYPISQADIELIALVTMGEVESEGEYAQRLVIDTILNRMDSEYWPDTVSEVVWQPGQFDVMWNGRLDRCCVRDDICQLVKEELINRSNYDVVFFRTDYFSTYGQPLFQVGNIFFSASDY